ncbi:hypothetical protein JCM10908_005951 [Rhodotorula pacifica]|uniref:cysteine hydrolase family protein n=1 Tax=Rhodotorula pacifica TaxID=1495444 RepID=UPI0031746A7A
MATVTADTCFRFRELNDFFRGPETVSTKDSALLVMDAQRFFAPDGQWPIRGIERSNKVIQELVERYRSADGCIVWAAQAGDSDKTLDDLAGTEWALMDEFRPNPGELFLSKAHGSAFFGTRLDEYLQSRNIKKIVLVGYQPQSSYAVHLGYRVFVVHDAIGSHKLPSWDNKREIEGPELVDSACDLLNDAMAVVIKASEVQD